MQIYSRQRMELKEKLLFTTLMLTIVVLFLENIVRIHDLYLRMSWIDNPLHIFGGMMISAFFLWLLYHKFPLTKNKRVVSVLFVFLISLLWEALENLYDSVFISKWYQLDFFFWDGVTDTIMATLGAILCMWLIYKLIDKRHKKVL